MAQPFPNLTGAQRALNRLMVDRCAILRDEEGVDDEVLDPDTLELTPPNPDETRVYTGPCIVKLSLSSDPNPEGGEMERQEAIGTVVIPHDAPLPIEGDVVRILDSPRDKTLVGRELFVEGVSAGTMLVARRLAVREVRRGSSNRVV